MFCSMLKQSKEQQCQDEQKKQNQCLLGESHTNLTVGQSMTSSDGSSHKQLSSSQQKDSKTQLNNRNINKILIQPIQLSEQQLNLKISKDHFIFKEWKRSSKGGLVCIDLELIEQQKKMLKVILTSIGKNISKMKINGSGIMNMCLPVTIFKKQSHLQSIARTFSYAPILLDSVCHSNDTLERFKACIIFAVSNCILGISTKKPFNPILGETFQCWIGGCPLYLQQISHHPPISSYYFQGRGYKVYGNVEAKVSLGLNGVKCWSQKLHCIQFQDGNKIYFLHPKMLVKNLILGERQFHFTDKIFAYDTNNEYLAQITFGPKNKGFFSNSNSTEPEDIISGKILKITKQFVDKFKSSNIMTAISPNQEDIEKQLCTIDGIWNQIIKFDGKEYFDFSKSSPFEMQDQQFPLPSNSPYRLDIQYLQKNQVDLSQSNKERLQQIQRNDRRLRQMYKNQ